MDWYHRIERASCHPTAWQSLSLREPPSHDLEQNVYFFLMVFHVHTHTHTQKKRALKGEFFNFFLFYYFFFIFFKTNV